MQDSDKHSQWQIIQPDDDKLHNLVKHMIFSNVYAWLNSEIDVDTQEQAETTQNTCSQQQ